MKSFFTETLLAWHHAHPRPMPWSGEKDPYRIWLSEMILQQTRVKQGTAYYLALTEAFPTIQDLANASEEKILRRWQGLSYRKCLSSKSLFNNFLNYHSQKRLRITFKNNGTK
jgi:A/G-specific adenine glycosylase